MSKWIKTSERPPTTDTVFFAYGRKVAGQNRRFVYQSWYNKDNDFWYTSDEAAPLYDVTHWRHMIMPPSEA